MSDQQEAKQRKSGPRTATTIEEASKVGFFGTEVDPTPDENYTLAGQGAHAPTPETDAKLADAVKRHQREHGLG